jgi:hypothetical protein
MAETAPDSGARKPLKDSDPRTDCREFQDSQDYTEETLSRKKKKIIYPISGCCFFFPVYFELNF